MKTTFKTLKKDHIYFKQLLDQIDKQTNKQQPEKEPEWSLVAHIVNTLCYYPDLSHHRMEDDILDLLKMRHWISDLVIESIHRDHELLHALGVEAEAKLLPEKWPTDKQQTKCTLSVISAFTSAYRAHIRTEEELVFPMIEKLICEQEPNYTNRRDNVRSLGSNFGDSGKSSLNGYRQPKPSVLS